MFIQVFQVLLDESQKELVPAMGLVRLCVQAWALVAG